MGLREQKKKETRKSISDIATLLFIERGYHAVTMAEIAEKAKVSTPTVFNYFPTKESLVFDEDLEGESWLAEIVTNRRAGQSILDALFEAGQARIAKVWRDNKKEISGFLKLIEDTPELNAYSRQMFLRYEKTLAKAIRKEAKRKVSTLESEAIARFVLDSFHRSWTAPRPDTALAVYFSILREGWRD